LNLTIFGLDYAKAKKAKFDTQITHLTELFGMTHEMLDWFYLTYWVEMFDAIQNQILVVPYVTAYDDVVYGKQVSEVPSLTYVIQTYKKELVLVPELSLLKNFQSNQIMGGGPIMKACFDASVCAFKQRVFRANDLTRDVASKENSVLFKHSYDYAKTFFDVPKLQNITSAYVSMGAYSDDALSILRVIVGDFSNKALDVYLDNKMEVGAHIEDNFRFSSLSPNGVPVLLTDYPRADVYFFDLLSTSGIVKLNKDKTFFVSANLSLSSADKLKINCLTALMFFAASLQRNKLYGQPLDAKLHEDLKGKGSPQLFIIKIPIMTTMAFTSFYFLLTQLGVSYRHVAPNYSHEEWRWLVVDFRDIPADNNDKSVMFDIRRYAYEVIYPWMCAIERRHIIFDKTPSAPVVSAATYSIIEKLAPLFPPEHFQVFPHSGDLVSSMKDIDSNLAFIHFVDKEKTKAKKKWKPKTDEDILKEHELLNDFWSQAISFDPE